MKYKQTAYVEFSVGSKEFDAEPFFKTFLIAPTKVWKNRREEKIFEYRIDAKDALESLYEALDELRLIFSSKATEIKSYALQHDLYIKINVVVKTSNKKSRMSKTLSISESANARNYVEKRDYEDEDEDTAGAADGNDDDDDDDGPTWSEVMGLYYRWKALQK